MFEAKQKVETIDMGASKMSKGEIVTTLHQRQVELDNLICRMEDHRKRNMAADRARGIQGA